MAVRQGETHTVRAFCRFVKQDTAGLCGVYMVLLGNVQGSRYFGKRDKFDILQCGSFADRSIWQLTAGRDFSIIKKNSGSNSLPKRLMAAKTAGRPQRGC